MKPEFEFFHNEGCLALEGNSFFSTTKTQKLMITVFSKHRLRLTQTMKLKLDMGEKHTNKNAYIVL
jgi:hypothetical protein